MHDAVSDGHSNGCPSGEVSADEAEQGCEAIASGAEGQHSISDGEVQVADADAQHA